MYDKTLLAHFTANSGSANYTVNNLCTVRVATFSEN